jgi:hypothetical protein
MGVGPLRVLNLHGTTQKTQTYIRVTSRLRTYDPIVRTAKECARPRLQGHNNGTLRILNKEINCLRVLHTNH